MRASAAVIITIATVLILAGCASGPARDIRTTFAVESEFAARDAASEMRKIALYHIEQGVRHEIDRLQGVLAAQNVRARGVPERIAQNYIDYYTAMDTLRRRTSDEYAKVESLYAEQASIAKGFRALNSMANEELRVSRETANAALAAAIGVAEQLWREYQAQKPPPKPEKPPEAPHHEHPEPTPTPAVTIDLNAEGARR